MMTYNSCKSIYFSIKKTENKNLQFLLYYHRPLNNFSCDINYIGKILYFCIVNIK